MDTSKNLQIKLLHFELTRLFKTLNIVVKLILVL